MEHYAMLIFSAVLLAGNFALNKVYQQKAGVSFEKGLKFNIFLGIFTAFIFFIIGGFRLRITFFSMLMAAGMAILSTIYTLIGFRIISGEKMVLYTVSLMIGGMAVPYVWGLLFLNEPFSLLRTAGMAVIILSVLLTYADTAKPDVKQILMCCAVFFLNGFVSVISKEHQINSAAISAVDFVTLSSILKAGLCAAALCFVNREKNEKKQFSFRLTAVVLICALLSGLAYLFQLIGAENLPATVLYPIVTGGSILFSTLAGRLFFKEKLTPKLLAGIALSFLGTCMFL